MRQGRRATVAVSCLPSSLERASIAPFMGDNMERSALNHVVVGAGLLLVGLTITGLTFAAAVNSRDGGVYVLCIGAILVGLADLLYGLAYGLETWLAGIDPFANAPLESRVLMQTLIYGASTKGPLDRSAILRVRQQFERVQGKRYRPAVIKRAARAMDRKGVDVLKYLAQEEPKLSETFKQILVRSYEGVFSWRLTPAERQACLTELRQVLQLPEEVFA